MLEQTHSLGLDQLVDHVAKDSTNGVEPLVCVADVGQPSLVQKDFLDDENRNGFGQFRARLHDAQAQGNNFRGQEEVNDRGVVILLEGHERQTSGRHAGHTLTKAPMTPREVRRRYSNGRVFEVVLRKGYKKRGI